MNDTELINLLENTQTPNKNKKNKHKTTCARSVQTNYNYTTQGKIKNPKKITQNYMCLLKFPHTPIPHMFHKNNPTNHRHNKTDYKTYGILNYNNHFQHLAATEEQRTNRSLFFMIRERKTKKELKEDHTSQFISPEFKKFLTHPKFKERIKKRFRDTKLELKICIKERETWAAIFYNIPNLQTPLDKQIRLICEAAPFKIRIKYPETHFHTPFRNKKEQFVAFTYNHKTTSNLIKFLTANEYCQDEPKTKNDVRKKNYITTWDMKDMKKINEMRGRWLGTEFNIDLQNSDYNERLITWQAEADAILQRMTHDAITHITRNNIQMKNELKKLIRLNHTQHIFSKQIEQIQKLNKQKVILRWPWMQIYHTKNAPIKSSIIASAQHKLLYMNIGGAIRVKLSKHHCYANRIVKTHNPDVVAIVDTRLGQKPQMKFNGYKMIFEKPGDLNKIDRTGGIIVFAKHKIAKLLTNLIRHTHTNLLWYNYKSYRYGIAYCRPHRTKINTNSDKNKTNIFFNQLNTDISEIKKIQSNKIVLVGDFNAHCGKVTGDKNWNHLGRKLNECTIKHNLTFASAQLNYGYPTWTNSAGNTAIDDHVISDTANNFQSIQIDASPIVITMRDPTIEIQPIEDSFHFRNTPFPLYDQPAYQKKHKIAIQMQETWLQKVKTMLNTKFTNQIYNEQKSAVISILSYYLIHKNIIKIFGLRKVNLAKKWESTNIDYINIQTLMDIEQQKFPTNIIEVNRLKNIQKEMLQQHQIDSAAQLTEEISDYNYSLNAKKVKWQFLKQNKFDVMDFVEVNGKWIDKNDAMKEHYKSIMSDNLPDSTDKILKQKIEQTNTKIKNANPPNLCTTTPIDNNNTESNNEEQQISTVESAIQATNAKGAPGYDKISQIHLDKTGSHKILEIMYDSWFEYWSIPSGCMLGIILCLQKIPRPRKPADFRPVTLLPVIFKVFERLITWKLNQLNVEKNLHPCQGGFRVHRGVLEQLGILRILSDIAKKNHKPIYVASLDIRKAIIHKLHTQFNVPIGLCKIIQIMLSNTYSGLRSDWLVSHIFQTKNGVVQGSVLSPLLYGVFINDLIEDLNNPTHDLGAKYIYGLIAALAYCDDILLTSHSPQKLRKLIKICEQHSQKWRYRFNPQKCKVLAFNHTQSYKIIKIPNNAIKEAQKAFNNIQKKIIQPYQYESMQYITNI